MANSVGARTIDLRPREHAPVLASVNPRHISGAFRTAYGRRIEFPRRLPVGNASGERNIGDTYLCPCGICTRDGGGNREHQSYHRRDFECFHQIASLFLFRINPAGEDSSALPNRLAKPPHVEGFRWPTDTVTDPARPLYTVASARHPWPRVMRNPPSLPCAPAGTRPRNLRRLLMKSLVFNTALDMCHCLASTFASINEAKSEQIKGNTLTITRASNHCV